MPCKEGLHAGEAGELVNNEIHIYPNPANELIFIQSNNTNEKNIQIIDAVGQIVMSEKTTLDILQLNIADLPAGIYVIQVNEFNKSTTINFIKQ
jgi:bacillolysin